MADLHALAKDLTSLTIKEANDLVGILKSDYGIEPAAGGGGIMMAAAPAAAAAEVVEKTEFEVFLKDAGASKLNVVKEVKNLLGLGLKEAKDLVDAAPSSLKTGANKIEAEGMKAALEAAGAVIELK